MPPMARRKFENHGEARASRANGTGRFGAVQNSLTGRTGQFPFHQIMPMLNARTLTANQRTFRTKFPDTRTFPCGFFFFSPTTRRTKPKKERDEMPPANDHLRTY